MQIVNRNNVHVIRILRIDLNTDRMFFQIGILIKM